MTHDDDVSVMVSWGGDAGEVMLALLSSFALLHQGFFQMCVRLLMGFILLCTCDRIRAYRICVKFDE